MKGVPTAPSTTGWVSARGREPRSGGRGHGEDLSSGTSVVPMTCLKNVIQNQPCASGCTIPHVLCLPHLSLLVTWELARVGAVTPILKKKELCFRRQTALERQAPPCQLLCISPCSFHHTSGGRCWEELSHGSGQPGFGPQFYPAVCPWIEYLTLSVPQSSHLFQNSDTVKLHKARFFHLSSHLIFTFIL